MARYCIFTEYRRKSIDFSDLRRKLSGLDMKVIGQKENRLVVEYDGNIGQFRELADYILNPMKNETTRIYIAAD